LKQKTQGKAFGDIIVIKQLRCAVN